MNGESTDQRGASGPQDVPHHDVRVMATVLARQMQGRPVQEGKHGVHAQDVEAIEGKVDPEGLGMAPLDAHTGFEVILVDEAPDC